MDSGLSHPYRRRASLALPASGLPQRRSRRRALPAADRVAETLDLFERDGKRGHGIANLLHLVI